MAASGSQTATKLIASTGIAAGLLLVVVPRYVLPACEYEGFPRMHCSDTALVERVLGGLLLAAGAIALASRRRRALAMACAAASGAILLSAWFTPDVTGYCPSAKMPCHYGMVPGVRFIVALAGIGLVTGVVLLARSRGRERESS